MFIAGWWWWLSIAKIWKQPKCTSVDEWIKMWYIYISHMYIGIYIPIYIYIYRNTTQSKKEWNFAICNNMDGLGGYYAYWNKSDRERQILYDVTYMWNVKK